MKRTTPLAGTLALLLATSTALAQAKPATGLDAVDDSRLQAELASRGLTTLLDHAFDVGRTPEAQRNGIRTLAALRQLSDPNAKLSAKQRDDVIGQVVKGIQAALPSLKDPKLLMQQAGVLITEGVNPDLSTLEYWGENPRLQASLRPIGETVQAIYDKAIVESEAAADAIANRMTGVGNVAIEKQWEEMDNLVTFARFNKAMSAYGLSRSIDKADPKRKQVADEAIAFLQPFDAPDTQVQPQARIRIAKLNLAKGDFATARKLFESIETDLATIKPKPGIGDRYEAKYFAAQSVMLAGDAVGARKAMGDLEGWQKANLPKEQQPAADALTRLLDYRISSIEAERATGPAKAKANDAAIATLVGLVKDYPQYRPIIFEQLLDRIPADADVTKLDPLLLAALMQKGEAERVKPDGEKVDAKALAGGASAAAELVARKGKEGVDPATVEDAAILLPLFLVKLDRKPEAAGAFLDYLKAYPDGKHARQAVDYAGDLILIQLPRTDSTNPALAGLMDRFLPLAIEKYGHKELAYLYAGRLRATEKFAEAVKYFRLVPDADANAAKARYYEMISLKQQLDRDDGKLGEAGRKQAVAAIQALADKVNTMAPAAERAATREQDKAFYKLIPARTAIMAADLAKREQKDSNRALALLNGLEARVKGLPGEDNLVSEALFLRVGSYMDLGQTDKATESLVALLNTKGGDQGLRIVLDLLLRLDQDYNAALAKNDIDAQRTLAKNRADLSGYLVTWAANNKEPKIKQFTYKYRVFDASSKQLAANLAVDPAEKKKGLEDALKLFQDLQSPENAALYKATLPPTTPDPNYPDPQVVLGFALVQYDLGNYAAAAPAFSRLLNDRKLGIETVEINQNGIRTRVDNDQFWEATYKQLKGFVEMAKAPNADDAAKRGATAAAGQLKRLYIQYGRGLGGKKWSPEFEKLRQEIAPDYQVQDLIPTTQPAPLPTADETAGAGATP